LKIGSGGDRGTPGIGLGNPRGPGSSGRPESGPGEPPGRSGVNPGSGNAGEPPGQSGRPPVSGGPRGIALGSQGQGPGGPPGQSGRPPVSGGPRGIALGYQGQGAGGPGRGYNPGAGSPGNPGRGLGRGGGSYSPGEGRPGNRFGQVGGNEAEPGSRFQSETSSAIDFLNGRSGDSGLSSATRDLVEQAGNAVGRSAVSGFLARSDHAADILGRLIDQRASNAYQSFNQSSQNVARNLANELLSTMQVEKHFSQLDTGAGSSVQRALDAALSLLANATSQPGSASLVTVDDLLRDLRSGAF